MKLSDLYPNNFYYVLSTGDIYTVNSSKEYATCINNMCIDFAPILQWHEDSVKGDIRLTALETYMLLGKKIV